MVGRASPRSLPIRLLTSPHDAIISNRWRSPQANFNTRCDGTPAMSWYVLPRAAQIRHSSSLFDSSIGSDVSLKLLAAAESIKTAIRCNFTIFRDLYSAQSAFEWLLV